jgi:hypothetical protein
VFSLVKRMGSTRIPKMAVALKFEGKMSMGTLRSQEEMKGLSRTEKGWLWAERMDWRLFIH